MEYVSPIENNTAWQATLDGHYAEALLLWDAILEREKAIPLFMNRGTTRLLSGDMNGALADFTEARRLARHGSIEDVGMVLWLLGEHDTACRDWADETARIRSRVITHSDAARGVQPPALL